MFPPPPPEGSIFLMICLEQSWRVPKCIGDAGLVPVLFFPHYCSEVVSLPCHPAAPLAFLPGGAYGTTAGTQSEIAGLQQVLPQAAASSLRAALGRGCLHYVYRLAFQEPEGLEMIGKRSMNVLLTACLKSLTLQRACTTIAILSLSVVKFLNATSSGGLTTFLFLKSSCLCEIALFR